MFPLYDILFRISKLRLFKFVKATTRFDFWTCEERNKIIQSLLIEIYVCISVRYSKTSSNNCNKLALRHYTSIVNILLDTIKLQLFYLAFESSQVQHFYEKLLNYFQQNKLLLFQDISWKRFVVY